MSCPCLYTGACHGRSGDVLSIFFVTGTDEAPRLGNYPIRQALTLSELQSRFGDKLVIIDCPPKRDDSPRRGKVVSFFQYFSINIPTRSPLSGFCSLYSLVDPLGDFGGKD